MLDGFICRYMNVESPVLPTLSIYGQTIAISKSRPAMIPMLSESKSLIKNDPPLQGESIGCAISLIPLFTASSSPLPILALPIARLRTKVGINW